MYANEQVNDTSIGKTEFIAYNLAKGGSYMDVKVFGEFIAKRRKSLNMTQIELADKLFVTSKAVSRWERGVGFPDINTLEPLANALELTVTELVSCKKSSNNQLVEDVLNIVKEEDKVNIRKHKRTLLIILLGLIVTIFLHVVTFSNHESGWMICFILAFLSAISNLFLTFYNNKHLPYLLAFFSVLCLSLGISESYLMMSNWIVNKDIAALYDVVLYEAAIINTLMYIVITINISTFILKFRILKKVNTNF